MSLPAAVASGPAAQTPDAVSPVRVAIGAGLLAALYLLVLYIAQPVPTRLLSAFGGASNDVERHGGLEMVWLPPAAMTPVEVIERFRAGEDRAQLRRDGDRFVIGVPRVRREDVEETAKRLGGEHGLEFHVVMQTGDMVRLAQQLQLPMKGELPVDVEVDQWRGESSGELHTDYYLLGTSREVIDGKLAEARAQGWSLSPGTKIAYEYIEPALEAPDRGRVPMWRTYVIASDAALAGGSIANAMKSYDPNTNRPVVLLDFDEAGAQKFGELTAMIVGEKLAITIGDQVYSAPIINDAIRGGRASVAMGGGDPMRQEREAELLVNTLRAGALPAGGKIEQARYVEPVADGVARWLARGVLALGVGALIGLLVWVVIRVTRPVRRLPARFAGPQPWSRLFVTLAAPVAVYAVAQVTALGIDTEELIFAFGGTGFTGGGPDAIDALLESLSFGALGIMPVINAYIFVEVLALIVPGWRRRRHAGPAARAPINTAVAITAVTLLVVQSWFVTQYLYALGDVMPYGVGPRMLVVASFATGTLVLVIVAALIREHGLGNGYGALIAGGFAIQVVGRWLDGPLLDGNFVIGGITMLAIAIPLAVVARWRVARLAEAPLRLPSSGIAPLGDAGGLVLLIAVLSKFPVETVTLKLHEWTIAARTHHGVVIALVAVLTLVWSFAFARPGVTRRLAERVGLVAPARATWWAATGVSVALLLLVGTVAMTTAVVRPSAAWLVDTMTIALVAMVVLDIVDDWRARRVALERVWSLHQPQHADLVTRALDDAGIPHHLASANLRTLLAFFGPFAPIDVLVPPEHAPAARDKLRTLFE